MTDAHGASRLLHFISGCGIAGLLLTATVERVQIAQAQPSGPSMLRPNLGVRAVVSNLVTPTAMAFLGANDFLILEKNTGKVQRVVNGAPHSTALDLAVNAASERGLLGIALHPDFPANPRIYLYWTCSAPASGDPFKPAVMECPDTPATGVDTEELAAVPLLGDRVDRFVWNGATLTFERNLIKLLAFRRRAARGGEYYRRSVCPWRAPSAVAIAQRLICGKRCNPMTRR